MTVAPHRRPLEFDDIESIAAAVRDGGGRLTTARRALLEALFMADGLVSADEIADGMNGRVIRTDVGSVYRNLEFFERLGVVRHVHLGHGPGLYTLDHGDQREYLVCSRCRRVDVVPSDQLDTIRAEVAKRFAYTVQFGHFPIVGLCADCTPASSAHAS